MSYGGSGHQTNQTMLGQVPAKTKSSSHNQTITNYNRSKDCRRWSENFPPVGCFLHPADFQLHTPASPICRHCCKHWQTLAEPFLEEQIKENLPAVLGWTAKVGDGSTAKVGDGSMSKVGDGSMAKEKELAVRGMYGCASIVP